MIVDGKSRCCAQPSSASNASNVKYLTPFLRLVADRPPYADCAAAACAGFGIPIGLAGRVPRAAGAPSWRSFAVALAAS